MEHIILQIALKLVKKTAERAYAGEIRDIDAMTSDILEDCKVTAITIVEEICKEMNIQIRKDKSARKEQGLVLKEKDRPRELLTSLGWLELTRDYYRDKTQDRYIYPLDHILGIPAYERVGGTISARMVSMATEVSYAKSAEIASEGEVSRQTVKKHLQKAAALEKTPRWEGKKHVKEIHIFADEDHAHLQSPQKKKGKHSKTVPLVTVTEGVDTGCDGRHRTLEPMHFIDEGFDTKELWKSAEGYLEQAYDLAKIEKIYIHGDGGKWIKNGLDDLPQVVHVMDGYHLEKRIRSISRMFPDRSVSKRIHHAITSADREKTYEILQSLYEAAEGAKELKAVSGFGSYLIGNWEEIVNRQLLDVPGSCTEGLVSHVLSERLSRDPMGWSEKGLGKVAKLRVYIKNGGEITAQELKEQKDQTYSDYADQVIEKAASDVMDWTIIDGERFIFDTASGTQRAIHDIGAMRNTLWS